VVSIAGRSAVAAVGAALLLVSGAAASTPDVASMTLQPADVPGAKVTHEGAVKEQGYVAAYARSFEFKSPYGRSRLIVVESEVALAATAAKATGDIASLQRVYASTTGRKALKNAIARQANVKPEAVVVGRLRKVGGYDQGFELPVSVKTKIGRVYENISLLRLDRVVLTLAETAVHGIAAADTGHFASLVATHIAKALAPTSTAPPAITGTAQQGQTLTASPGTWTADDATLTYQWQHCDAAGANCADIAGATAQTYAVTPTDVNTTLRVVEKATNRFGSPTATSAPTAVVT
jgi:hypothetical protein